MPIILTARTPDGARIETSGETLDVNEHGARVRTLDPLPDGCRLRVAIVNPYRWRAAQVVWVGGKDPCECGIELERPGEFWGMYFPPDEWTVDEPPRTSWRTAALVGRRPETKPAEAAPPPPAPKVDPLLILLAGTEVAISALSLVRSVFQERTQVLGIDQGFVVLELRRVVNPGTRCRLRARGHSFNGVVDKITQRPVAGRWGVWVKF